jgi:IS5 family transposase
VRRQAFGKERLAALVQESLAVAPRTGAAKPSDFSKVIVDTTVQEKAVAFPTDAPRSPGAQAFWRAAQ